MTFLATLFASDNKPPSPTDNFWYNGINGSGRPVNAAAAMRVAAVYACVDVISETVGMLPFILYKRLDNQGKERAIDHPLFSVLRLSPNKRQSAIQFRSLLIADALLRGCGYAEIIPGQRGFANQLKRIDPDNLTVEEMQSGRVRFKIRQTNGIERILSEDEVFTLPGKFSDGISKVNAPITLMMQTVGIASEQERHNKNQLENGIRLSGVLETDTAVKEEVGKKILDSWKKMFTGSRSAEKVALLPLGLKFKQMSMTNEDAQFIEGMQFTNKQIARFFRVPPHKIGILDDATFSNIEQQNQEFVTDTIMAWLVRFEQAVSNQLLLDDEREKYFAEFLLDALMRGDSTARASYYSTLVTIGAMTRNEVRVKENMNPLDGLDEPLQQLNMTSGGTQQKQEQKPFMQPKKKKGSAALDEQAHLKKSFAGLITENAGRVVRAEEKAVSRILSKKKIDADKLYDWACDFYSEHIGFAIQVFSSTIHTYEQLSGQNIDIGQVLEGYMLGRKEALINGNWQADEEKMTTLLVNLILETDHG